MGSVRAAQAGGGGGTGGGGGGGSGCRRRWLKKGGGGGEGWERRGSAAQAGAAELSGHSGTAEDKEERPGTAQPSPEAPGRFLFCCAERQAARVNNSSYTSNPPSRSRKGLGLPRPSYCLETCQELGSQQSHRVPAPRRRLSSPPFPSLGREKRKQPGEAKGLEEDGLPGTADAESGAAPGARRRDVGRTPTVAVAGRIQSLGKVPAL